MFQRYILCFEKTGSVFHFAVKFMVVNRAVLCALFFFLLTDVSGGFFCCCCCCFFLSLLFVEHSSIDNLYYVRKMLIG